MYTLLITRDVAFLFIYLLNRCPSTRVDCRLLVNFCFSLSLRTVLRTRVCQTPASFLDTKFCAARRCFEQLPHVTRLYTVCLQHTGRMN